MKLSQLSLCGFKSFVEDTEIDLSPGLNGVVGPNGCGKTNFIEAIRWVMGETSYKTLRASEMSDVIFAGTRTRTARNIATVTITMDNSDHDAPAPYSRLDLLEISRIITRDEGSNYRINGQEVRARDVQLLFADSATGAHSASMMRQGHVADIVTATPAQRRKVIEDAAGITGLNTRRQEAKSKLSSAQDNLERLGDIINILEDQKQALQKQARVARRYKKITEQIRDIEISLYAIRWGQMSRQLKHLQRELGEASQQQLRLQEMQAMAAKDQSVTETQFLAAREKALEVASGLRKFHATQVELTAKQRAVEDQISQVKRQKSEVEQDIEREKDNLNHIVSRFESQNKALDIHLDELKSSVDVSQEKENLLSTIEELKSKRQDLQSKIETHSARMGAAQTNEQQLRNRLEEETQQLANIDRQIESVTEQQRQIDVDEASLDISHLEQVFRQASEALTKQKEGLDKEEKALEDTQRALSDKSDQLRLATGELDKIKIEIDTLTRLLNTSRDTSFPPVKEQLHVKPGYERALFACLRDDLDSSLDENAPHRWQKRAPVKLPAWPDDVLCLAEVVTAPDQLQSRLLATAVVSFDQARHMQPLLQPGQRLVSEKGDLWRWDGLYQAFDEGSSDAKWLHEQTRLEELKPQLGTFSQRVEKLADERNVARAQCEAVQANKQTIQVKCKDAANEEERARRNLAHARQKLHSLALKRESLVSGTQNLEKNKQQKSELITRFTRDLKEAQDELALFIGVDDGRQSLTDLEHMLEGLQRQFAQIDQKLSTAKEKTRALERELEEWDARKLEAQARLQRLEERQSRHIETLADLEALPSQLETQIAEVVQLIVTAEHQQSEAREALALLENKKKTADDNARSMLDKLSNIRENMIRFEERISALDQTRSSFRSEVFDKFDWSLKQLMQAAERLLDEGTEKSSLDEVINKEGSVKALEERLQVLLKERERIGGVNLLADEELLDLEQRAEKLAFEKQDLEQAISQLLHMIKTLNEEGAKRLMAAFVEVDSNFQQLYQQLFSGGTAKLMLTESEDPLNAGLEIMAQPPGKRLQTLSLLSGGEQTLTALALVLAVFFTTPSPICVMDEVDAPLDDQNVERFCRLLHHMKQRTDTCYLVITHNPITMSEMDRLYGVTMSEPGVSQLVSVNLEAAEQLTQTG